MPPAAKPMIRMRPSRASARTASSKSQLRNVDNELVVIEP